MYTCSVISCGILQLVILPFFCTYYRTKPLVLWWSRVKKGREISTEICTHQLQQRHHRQESTHQAQKSWQTPLPLNFSCFPAAAFPESFKVRSLMWLCSVCKNSYLCKENRRRRYITECPFAYCFISGLFFFISCISYKIFFIVSLTICKALVIHSSSLYLS